MEWYSKRSSKLENIREWEWLPPVQSRCQIACRLPSAGLWEGPRLVKPTDGTGRAAVHRSPALLMAAQMWDKQIEHCVWTWSSCTFHAYLLAFCGRVVFRLSPVAAIVLRGHLFFFFFTFLSIWQMLALLRYHGSTPQWAFVCNNYKIF